MSFDEYEIGKLNKFGKEISDIIFRAEGKYVIYSCKNGSVINFDGSEDVLNNIATISKKLAKIEILTHNMKDCFFINSQLVYAISTAADGKTQEANEILDTVEMKILIQNRNTGKISYLSGSLFIITLEIIFLIVINLLHNWTNNEIWTKYILLNQIAIGASLGGFLSIMLKINSLNIDSEGKLMLNFVNGSSRIIISIISGISIYLLIKSNIILGAVNQVGSSYAMYVFAIISGFSEKFVPNLFNKIETDTLGSKQITQET